MNRGGGRFVFSRLYFFWRAGISGVVLIRSSGNIWERLDKPSPRTEYSSITGGNAIGEAAWQNERAWGSERISYELAWEQLQ